jgi:hypothetical protein
MFTLSQTLLRLQEQFQTPRERRWRLPLLCICLGLALGHTLLLALLAPSEGSQIPAFVSLWLIGFVPYLVASIVILTTHAPAGRRRWLELALILSGALFLRILLLSNLPNLSPDSWRYLWDARVTLHGYSPYVYPPGDPQLAYLRDFLYENSRFRDVPTIYPPGAQAIYLLSYLIAPSNLFVLKGIFVFFDMVVCCALAALLLKRRLDPARCLIYAWCPLPIVEFAMQGHVDVLTIAFTILAILCSMSNWRGARACTGLLVGLATITKFYPLLMLAAISRRRDWVLWLTCGLTILVSYIPYVILGQGKILGFLTSYNGEYSANSGVVSHLMFWLSDQITGFAQVRSVLTYLVALALVGGTTITVWLLRLRERISREAAMLLLIGSVFAVSPHVFPWYTTALLPWVAVLIGPLWRPESGFDKQSLAVALTWYFVCASTLGYFFAYLPFWYLYYIFVYGLFLAGLTGIVLFSLLQKRGLVSVKR